MKRGASTIPIRNSGAARLPPGAPLDHFARPPPRASHDDDDVVFVSTTAAAGAVGSSVGDTRQDAASQRKTGQAPISRPAPSFARHTGTGAGAAALPPRPRDTVLLLAEGAAAVQKQLWRPGCKTSAWGVEIYNESDARRMSDSALFDTLRACWVAFTGPQLQELAAANPYLFSEEVRSRLAKSWPDAHVRAATRVATAVAVAARDAGRGSRVLFIGAGNGVGLTAGGSLPLGSTVTHAETHTDCVPSAPHVQRTTGDGPGGQPASVSPASCDAFVASRVFRHAGNVPDHVQAAASYLKAGGVFVITTEVGGSDHTVVDFAVACLRSSLDFTNVRDEVVEAAHPRTGTPEKSRVVTADRTATPASSAFRPTCVPKGTRVPLRAATAEPYVMPAAGSAPPPLRRLLPHKGEGAPVGLGVVHPYGTSIVSDPASYVLSAPGAVDLPSNKTTYGGGTMSGHCRFYEQHVRGSKFGGTKNLDAVKVPGAKDNGLECSVVVDARDMKPWLVALSGGRTDVEYSVLSFAVHWCEAQFLAWGHSKGVLSNGGHVAAFGPDSAAGGDATAAAGKALGAGLGLTNEDGSVVDAHAEARGALGGDATSAAGKALGLERGLFDEDGSVVDAHAEARGRAASRINTAEADASRAWRADATSEAAHTAALSLAAKKAEWNRKKQLR